MAPTLIQMQIKTIRTIQSPLPIKKMKKIGVNENQRKTMNIEDEMEKHGITCLSPKSRETKNVRRK
jgi:hypothetical protein